MKKARKGEANYLPPRSQGETEESLEQERLELLSEVKKRNNSQIINAKMEKIFSIQRLEDVTLAPPVSDLKERWAALFLPAQVNAVFLLFCCIWNTKLSRNMVLTE